MTIPLNELKIKDKFINYIQLSYSYNTCHVVLNQLLKLCVATALYGNKNG